MARRRASHPSSTWTWVIGVLVWLLVFGCRGSAECAEGEVRVGDGMCVRLRTECPPGSFAAPGDSACLPLGVTACAPGFVKDGRGGCDPILPAEPCAPGTMAVPGDTTCRRVGVLECVKGFVADGKGGCNAVLPPSPCAAGLMAAPGETTCREVALCGSGKWGEIPIEPTNLYVDGAYVGGASDGSEAKPFVRIQDAIGAADGAKKPIIAIAAGTYQENLDVDRAVRIWGRCPRLVEVRGTTGSVAPAIVVRADAEVRRLSVTGERQGVSVQKGVVRLEELRVHDAGGDGVFARHVGGTTELVVRGSLVEKNHSRGIAVVASKLVVEATVVRDTQDAAGSLGVGISAEADPATKLASVLVVQGSLVEKNQRAGILVSGSKATIEATIVRETQPQLSDKRAGRGIAVETGSTVVVRASLVEKNHEVGIAVTGSKATIEATVVRDTQPQASDKKSGRGITIEVDPGTQLPSEVTVLGTLVEKNHDVGIAVAGSIVTVSATIVRETQPRASEKRFGRGINAQQFEVTTETGTVTLGTDLVVTGCLVERNHEIGIYVSGSSAKVVSTIVRETQPQVSDGKFGRGIGAQDSDTRDSSELVVGGSIVEKNQDVGIFVQSSNATVEATVVRDTQPRASDGKFGDGIAIFSDVPASLRVVQCLVERSARAGVSVFGASLALESSVVLCSNFDLDLERHERVAPQVEDRGGNVCGCGAKRVTCKGVSAGLEPMPRLDG